MKQDLADFRKSLDTIDNNLVLLLAERFRVTDKVGQYKKAHNLPPVDPAREAAHLEEIRQLAMEAGLDEDFAQKFLRLIMDTVVENHKRA
ncbi:MAG: chorismate mutase [Candidatus Saccharimonadales bacterium]